MDALTTREPKGCSWAGTPNKSGDVETSKAPNRISYMFKIVPVSQPGVDVRQFTQLLDTDTVNGIDSRCRRPAEKFSDLVAELLPDEFGCRHLFYGFYFELPAQSIVLMHGFAGTIHVSATIEGMMAKGIMTASLEDWWKFMTWVAHSQLLLSPLTVMLKKTLPEEF